jgi:ribosomal protein S17E
VEDWTTWARNTGAVHDTVVDFIASNERWLDCPKDSEPGKVTPSRRSWERLSRSLVSAGIADNPNDHMFYPMCLGFVGTEATIAFHSFAKTIENQVTGEEILRDYDKVKKKVAKLGQEKQNILIEKVADYVTKQLKSLDEKQGANLRKFMGDLPGELRVAAWSKLTQGSGTDNLELSKQVHKYCVETILECFGVSADSAIKALSTPATTKKAKK